MLFLIPEDDGVYSEFQQRSIHAEMDFNMDCRDVILEYSVLSTTLCICA
jgi:hypothetical protein